MPKLISLLQRRIYLANPWISVVSVVEGRVCYLRIRQNGREKYEQLGKNVPATMCLQVGRLFGWKQHHFTQYALHKLKCCIMRAV